MAKKKSQAGMMQARVLGGFVLDGVQYNSDDIIEASPIMIEQLGSSVDAHPTAVDHCLGLENPVIKKHESKAQLTPDPESDPESDPDSNNDPDENSDTSEDTNI